MTLPLIPPRGVRSVAGRTGAVTLAAADISGLTAAASAAAPVQSVAGRAGAVVIAAGDVSGFAAAVATTAPVDHPGYIVGLWYPTTEGATASSNAVSAADTLYVYPFFLRAAVHISRLAVRTVTGAASSSIKLGIWGNTAGRPSGTPVVGDNLTLATTANNTTLNTATFSPAPLLQPGVYWAGAVFTGLPTMSHLATSSFNVARTGTSTNTNAVTTQHVALTTAFTQTGDITALNLTGATWVYVTISGGAPAIAFEASA